MLVLVVARLLSRMLFGHWSRAARLIFHVLYYTIPLGSYFPALFFNYRARA